MYCIIRGDIKIRWLQPQYSAARCIQLMYVKLYKAVPKGENGQRYASKIEFTSMFALGSHKRLHALCCTFQVLSLFFRGTFQSILKKVSSKYGLTATTHLGTLHSDPL